MDKRFSAIIIVSAIEFLLRLAYPHVHLDDLLYTLIARAIELAAILVISYDKCGILTKHYIKETIIGIGVSVIFGTTVFALNFISIYFSKGDLLSYVLRKQDVNAPIMFFFVGCLFAPFVEEVFFRGLLYAWIRQNMSIGLSILISAVLFASMHGILSPVQLIGGIVFALLFEWRKNIWPSYMLHALANLGLWILPFLYQWS